MTLIQDLLCTPILYPNGGTSWIRIALRIGGNSVKAAAIELDPKPLMALIVEITRALDDRDERRNIASANQKTASRVFSVGAVA